jgi:hypothetical protein
MEISMQALALASIRICADTWLHGSSLQVCIYFTARMAEFCA